MVNSVVYMYDYVGAQPGGRPAPDLSTVLSSIALQTDLVFIFNLAFANDAGGGNFQPVWDPAITPEVTAQLTEFNHQDVFFQASLGGDANYGPWVPPSDQAAWVSNATSSLLQLIDTYSLIGIDVDYEGGPSGLDDSFVQCMSQVINNISGTIGQTFVTLAPFGGTSGPYLELYQQVAPWVTSVNYQAYADGISDVQGYLNLYSTLAAQFPGEQIGLGIASSNGQAGPADPTRGLQPPDIYSVWDSLHAQGTSPVAIWDLEDSLLWDPPYTIENTIISNS